MDKTEQAQARINNCFEILKVRRAMHRGQQVINIAAMREHSLILSQLTVLQIDLQQEGYLVPLGYSVLTTIETNLGVR